MSYSHSYPSWEIIRDKMIATIGQDPDVCIHELEEIECDRHCIDVSVVGRAKAEAIRKLLPREYIYGNVVVITRVHVDHREVIGSFGPMNAKQIANTVCIGLRGNRLFEVVVLPDECRCIFPEVFVLIVPKHIRLWGPDGQGFYEELASNLFAEVLRTSHGHIIRVKVIFTNRRRNDFDFCDIFCKNERCDR